MQDPKMAQQTGTSPTPNGQPGMSQHAQMLQQFGDQDPPDPQTFLKMIWPILTPDQKELVKAYLTQPPASAGQTGQPNVGQPATK